MDLKEKASFINDILKSYLPRDTKDFGDITESMGYSVLVGGKRLRGIMLLEAFRLFNQDQKLEEMLAHPYAAAIEFIHAYSLVHDDLPSMDNDMYRRGNLTTHAKYGHAMGVLTGDALLNYAFETIGEAQRSLSKLHGEYVAELYSRAANAFGIMARKAGFSGMIGGQVLDVCVGVSAEDMDPSRAKLKLLKIYELKTSALFQASLCAGAALAGASDEDIAKLDSFGYQLGLAFQIRDDILDVTSSLEVLGKDTGSDEVNNKSTIASVFGVEKAQEQVNERITAARALLEQLPGNTSFFNELLDYLGERDN